VIKKISKYFDIILRKNDRIKKLKGSKKEEGKRNVELKQKGCYENRS